jgi:mannose-6-phosphate isomerase-like protein (cupin superfamily)
MMAFIGGIEARARANSLFRAVVATGPHSQVVVMSLPPDGSIGEETHDEVDQVLVIVDGAADAVLEGVASRVGPGDLVLVPAGTRHDLVNRGPGDLRLYTIYAPPEHAPGTVHRTRAEAEAAEAAEAAEQARPVAVPVG